MFTKLILSLVTNLTFIHGYRVHGRPKPITINNQQSINLYQQTQGFVNCMCIFFSSRDKGIIEGEHK